MKVTKEARLSTHDMAYIALFAVMIAICSWISVPAAVPVTFQTFAVFLTVSVLGGKRGTMSVLIYLLMGAVGIPVFTGFTGGVGRLFDVTGGYIAGFLLAVLVMWGMEKLFGTRTLTLIFSMVLGLSICYAFGTAWYVFVYSKNAGETAFTTVLSACVIPFIVPDIAKMVFVLLVRKRLAKAIRINESYLK